MRVFSPAEPPIHRQTSSGDSGPGPTPDPGDTLLVDEDGAYLVDEDGAYLEEPA